MKSFKDANGNEWNVKINVGTAFAVQEALGLNLFEPASPIKEGDAASLAAKLYSDDVILGQVLAVILYPQLESKGLKAEEFFDLLDGQTMVDAEEAFTEEYANFFMARKRTVLKSYLDNLKNILKEYRASQEKEYGKLLENARSATLEN